MGPVAHGAYDAQTMNTLPAPTLRLAVVGAGPVGLALALQAARQLPTAAITLFDARPLARDLSADARTLALSLGSVQQLERLGAWPAAAAAPIRQVHVSQAPAGVPLGPAQPSVRLDAAALQLPMLGAVLGYGALLAPLQAAWLAAAAAEPGRLFTRFGTPVAALKPIDNGVELDAGIAEPFDLAVVAEGGVYAEQARKRLAAGYGQTAWVGTLTLAGGGVAEGTAYERFTRDGPLALLPLLPLEPLGPAPSAAASGAAAAPAPADGTTRAALVWCVAEANDPVRALDNAQRLALLASRLPPEAGRPLALSPLKDFALGLNAETSQVQGRVVRIGNAAQTLHPVAGQGLNLGLRDAHTLVDALRLAPDIDRALTRMAWQRAPDRLGLIAATDFLARSFTWSMPGAAALRGLGLAALDATPSLKAALARRMMFGWR
jgi:2-octaprenyl-6-methoxyphenol hydroxylase